MQCKEIELVLEQEGLELLPEDARAHLAECRDCRNYIADLTSLVDAAKKLPSEITPPDRVWISLRAQLEAEGIIRTPAEIVPAESASWWPSISAWFRNRVVATAVVGILIAAAAIFQIRNDRAVPTGEFAGTAQALNDQEPVATGMILASTSPVDASLRDNLKKVNEFIADCERHLREQPQDELTREYLSAAYQQKAELLSAMIERGRSMN
jgi:hypothetical protein